MAEISLATSGALAALERCAEELSDRLLLGAGTVRTLGDAERALEAGARFLVSPNLDRDVCAVARERDVLHLPGIFSPTELADALASGAELIKLFPAGRLAPGTSAISSSRFPTRDSCRPAESASGTRASSSTPARWPSRSARRWSGRTRFASPTGSAQRCASFSP